MHHTLCPQSICEAHYAAKLQQVFRNRCSLVFLYQRLLMYIQHSTQHVFAFTCNSTQHEKLVQQRWGKLSRVGFNIIDALRNVNVSGKWIEYPKSVFQQGISSHPGPEVTKHVHVACNARSL